MILQALNQYYDRLSRDPESDIAPPGYSFQQIHFALVINTGGKFQRAKDIRNYEGKKPQPVELVVPEAVVRSGKPTKDSAKPNFLWDNTGYVLGVDDKGKPENTQTTFGAFRDFHHLIGDGCRDAGMQAVLKFLDNWDPTDIDTFPIGREMVELKANLVFLLEGDSAFVHQRPAIQQLWSNYKADRVSPVSSTCLVTGDRRPIARLHGKIKGVQRAQSSGASIVSFNLGSFRSYNKEQNFNAPISEEAAFAYTTALNYLLRRGSKQKIQIGDATTVFWTERESPIEAIWGDMFNSSNTDAADAKEVNDYLSAIREGKHVPNVDSAIRMYVLGLSPNASRIAVRFWLMNTIGTFDKNLGNHFANLRIHKQYETDKEFPGIWHLLIETLPNKKELRKTKNINPLLAGTMTRAVLTGGRYPEALLATVLTRMNTDGAVNYYRAALIKAILKRNHHKEINMSLDEGNNQVSYRLGRLFAVLEKAQEEAIPGANTTIRDRFYGAASTTPAIAFPQLIRMSQHHLSKVSDGSRIAKEKLIQSIVDDISEFPRHLPLQEQGLFSLGYYQQRNAFFKKTSTVAQDTTAGKE